MKKTCALKNNMSANSLTLVSIGGFGGQVSDAGHIDISSCASAVKIYASVYFYPVQMKTVFLIFLFAIGLTACGGKTPRERMFDELKAQSNVNTPFPTFGFTYASFDTGHGYQVEYLSPRRADLSLVPRQSEDGSW